MKTLLRILSTWIALCAANAATITGGTSVDLTAPGAIGGTTPNTIEASAIGIGVDPSATYALDIKDFANIYGIRIVTENGGGNLLIGYSDIRANLNLQIGTSGNGTLSFFTNGSTRWTVDQTGHLAATGALNITTTGNIAVGEAYASTQIKVGNVATGASLYSPGDGILRLSDSATGTIWNRLTFGGDTSAYVGLKRSGTTLAVRLADDSADASLTASNLISATVGSGLQIKGGSVLARAGELTLITGTKTIANTTVTANTVIMLTRKTSGGTLGTAITYTVSAGTSFTVTSDSALDTSTFAFFMVEVNP